MLVIRARKMLPENFLSSTSHSNVNHELTKYSADGDSVSERTLLL